MARTSLRCFALAVLGLSLLSACTSPFSPHAQDVRDAWERKIERAHRRWDRHFNGLDWNDPAHEWHDESYARGPRIR